MINNYNQLVLNLNINLLHNKNKFEIRQIDLRVVEKMHQLNLINFFEKKNNKFIISVNTKFSKKIKIHQYNRNNSKLYFSVNQIRKKKLQLGSTIFLFSTPLGILTQYEAIEKNHGGFLMGKVTFM